MRLSLPLAVAVLTATATAQFSVVIPNGFDTVEGNSSNAFPWGRGGTGLLEQCIYDSSHFTLQGITYPILVTGLKWRPNTGVGLVASSYTSGCTVKMSTCPLDQASASTITTANEGADLTTCFSGVVSWGAQAAQTGPTPFGISIPFTSNFLYDPNLGDLNIECDLPVQTFTGTGPQLDVVSTAGVANASRVYMSTGYPAGTVFFNANHAVVVEVDYVPASGLYAGFSANVTSGPSPLAVQFTDHSYTSDAGGITGWAWDFDGDGIIDSNLQNPTFIYNGCGNFNVSLTVTDNANPPSTLTRTDYIKTDEVTANFTSQVVGPFAVLFTDTSTPAGTSWAWDLDGDSIIDSTAQNPGFVYPNANQVQVTLTVTRNCQSSTVTKTIVPTQQLSTDLTANNSVGAPATLYYNLDVLNPAGIQVNSFDSITTNLSTPFTVDWYVKIGTYSGFELNPAPWTLVGQASGTSNPVASSPSNASFAQPLYLPAGSYGIAMRFVGITARYTTLAALTTYSNGDLALTAGSASLSTAGPFTGTNLNTPRAWSGTLYYSTYNVTGSSGAGFFGPGCAGSLGVSHQTIQTFPQLGGSLSVDVSNMPLGFGLMILGTSNTLSGGVIPLPADLAAIGAPGCPLRVSADVLLTFAGAGTTVNWSFPVPNSATLSGLQFYNQAAVVDLSANALGLVTSDAIGWIVGS